MENVTLNICLHFGVELKMIHLFYSITQTILDAGSFPSVYLTVLKQKIKQYQQCDDFPQPPVETQQET